MDTNDKKKAPTPIRFTDEQIAIVEKHGVGNNFSEKLKSLIMLDREIEKKKALISEFEDIFESLKEYVVTSKRLSEKLTNFLYKHSP